MEYLRIQENKKNNTMSVITNLIFPDYMICKNAIYKKTGVEQDKQRKICEKMKENLLNHNPDDAKRIQDLYNLAMNHENIRHCLFDLEFSVMDTGDFASDEQIEACKNI